MNQEVIIDAFINNVEKLYYKHPDAGEDGFGSEFQTIKKQSFALKKNQNFQSSVGELVENKKKSRYKDILPFDHSRVKLPLWDGTTSDYINASFIEGPDRNRSYIASQGPLPHTVDDFWRMLWGCNVKVIIMVCREVELGKRKCEMYWEPTENKKSFGDISITLDSTDNSEKAFCKRTIIAKRGNETRTFYQLHYMTWPDHDVPRTRDDILQMISTARKLQDYSSDVNTPLCVHCSAGCGRTGAVLVIDYFRDLLLHKKLTSNIRVLDVVLSMRQQRPAIVQTKEQYEFVNLAVSEMFAKHMIESGKSLSSNLSKSLMSTDYENVVIKQKESPKPAIRRSEVQATTPARNNYENVQLDFGNPSIASKKNWLPEPTSPSKSKENKPVTPKRPFSSNSVPHDHHSNFQSNTTAKPKTPETSPPSSGLIGRMQASLQGDSLHSQSNMKLKTNADPKSPSPPHQAVKPRLRSTAPDSKRSNASAESVHQVNEAPSSFVSESVQSRKDKLFSQLVENSAGLHGSAAISTSVSDLRKVHEPLPSVPRRSFSRYFSVVSDLKRTNSSNNISDALKPTVVTSPNRTLSSDNEEPPAQKPVFTSATVTRTGSNSVKISKTYYPIINNAADATTQEFEEAVGDTLHSECASSTKSETETFGYVNVTTNSSSSSETASVYTHLSNSNSQARAASNYDFLTRSFKGVNEKHHSGQKVNVNKHENMDINKVSIEDIASNCDTYSKLWNHPLKNDQNFEKLNSPVRLNSPSIYECATAFEEQYADGTTYSSIPEQKERDLSKTNTNTSPKPLLPLKLKQTFKQKSNPPLQKNLKEEAITLSRNGGQSYDVTYSMSDEVDIATEELYAFPSDDVQSGILHSNTAAYYSTLTNENHLVEQHDSIYCLEESRDSSQIYEQVDHNNGARRKASGGLSKLNVATPNSNKVEMKRHSSHTPPVSEMPPLPERTTESYEVLENPDLSSYEDLGTTTKPVENTRRISGTTSALAGVGAKAKNLLGRKHHSRTKSEKKSSLNGTSRTFFAGANVKEESTKTVHTSSVPESNIAPKNQFQFPRRGAKKPKGPKPKPSTWPKFSEK